MHTTPTSRLKLTPSNSPYLQRPSRSPLRGRQQQQQQQHESRLALKRVVGTTCCCPTGFDAVQSCFAYIAGGAVVVVDVDGQHYSQRFYRARPTAQPIYGPAPSSYAPSTPTATPKANDSRNRVALGIRDSYGQGDWSESPNSRTWTSRERIKAATCLALSRDGRYLAVGETGYAPRVLIFGLEDSSSDVPLVSISEHAFGVKAVAWSVDSRWLASLGAANDGFLYIWKIDARTGAAKLHQQNRCTSNIRGMVWMGNQLVTLGVRHVKVWKIDEGQSTSPVKQKFSGEAAPTPSQPQRKALPGRNVLLGPLLDSTFTCAAVVDDARIIICSEAGDLCIIDDDGKQMRLARSINVGFAITCITIRHATAYVGGRAGQFVSLSVRSVLDCLLDGELNVSRARTGLAAMGFLIENLITIDVKHSIDIWSSSYRPGQTDEDESHIQLPGHGDQILGIQALPKPNDQDAAFLTWSSSGKVLFWDIHGRIKSRFDVPIESTSPSEVDCEGGNQLNVVRATKAGKLLVAGDKAGVLRLIDTSTKQCLLETKAHASECQGITIYEEDDKLHMASCGRDRTIQLFRRSSNGAIEHFQTLDAAAKVVKVLMPSADKIIACSLDRSMQVYDVVSKEDDPDAIAALSSRHITLKASPTSVVLGSGNSTAFVSMLDRSVCQYDLATGKQLSSFRCVDEGGVEAAILDSLIWGDSPGRETGFLLGLSNTDKSVRLYDAQNGHFVDREWGHTEAINGVVLVDDHDEGCQSVISVGSDGTMMRWALDAPQESSPGSMSRDPSPVKGETMSSRPPLRRVLSKAELAEFQRPSPTPGRRSPPRTLARRSSRYGAALNSTVTPKAVPQLSPSATIAEDTPSRRTSSGSRSGSPPASPKARVSRRPSLPALSVSSRKKSSPSLRGSGAGGGFGSLNMATEQACRTLRAYRKKLTSTDPIAQDALAELDTELRLTAAALGDRQIRSKAMSESVISGLLDQYEERLASILDEKLRLTFRPPTADTDGATKGPQLETPVEVPNERAEGESTSS